MMEFIDSLKEFYLGKCLITLFLSMVPVIELRGAIPAGVIMGLPIFTSSVISIIGNLIPVPFIIVFIRKIFDWMTRKSQFLGRVAKKFESKALAHSKSLYAGQLIGLMLFVAIPLPGTGAWTGALIAAILKLRLKAAFPAIAAGVVIAGICVTIITFGVKAIFV